MGNHTATPSVSESNIASNFSGGIPCFMGFCWNFIFLSFTDMINHCQVQTGEMGWLGLKIFLLLTALPANTSLMWILLRSKKTMTPSELLGLNISIMDILYCVCLPLDVYTTLHDTSEMIHNIREALFSLNIFGCPLLLALKRRALKNILAVTVPSIVAYSPLVAVVPYLAVILSNGSEDISSEQCSILQFLLAFPSFGLYIGPMFYLSRLRQLICRKKEKPNANSKTQAEYK